MFKKLLVGCSLALVYFVAIAIIYQIIPESNWRFVFVGVSAALLLTVSRKINERWFS